MDTSHAYPEKSSTIMRAYLLPLRERERDLNDIGMEHLEWYFRRAARLSIGVFSHLGCNTYWTRRKNSRAGEIKNQCHLSYVTVAKPCMPFIEILISWSQLFIIESWHPGVQFDRLIHRIVCGENWQNVVHNIKASMGSMAKSIFLSRLRFFKNNRIVLERGVKASVRQLVVRKGDST